MNTKKDESKIWLESNPGKTERDWLIEQKCSSNQQRSDLERLLDLCDHLGVRYMFKHIDFIDELNEFCDANQNIAEIQNFKVECTKFIEDEKPFREYDLYFPSKHWVINIGGEQRDVDIQMKKNILDFPFVERLTLQKDSFGDLYDKFIAFLNEKYHYPCYDKGNDTENTYLPWCKELELADFIHAGFFIKPDYVSSFYKQLFKEDFEKASKKSIEDFLANNPDLRKLRTAMLNDRCKTMPNNKKSELSNLEIQKQLKQVDKELASTYPAFKEAALI